MLAGNNTKLWICNMDVTDEWNQNMTRKMKNPSEKFLVNALSEVNLLLGEENDYLVLNHPPNSEYIKDLKSYGFIIPHLLITGNDDNILEYLLDNPEWLQERLDGSAVLTCYGMSAKIMQLAKLHGLDTFCNSNWELHKRIDNKIFSRKLAEDLGFHVPQGRIIRNAEEMLAAWHFIKASGYNQVIVKEPYGVSGRGLYIVKEEKELTKLIRLLRLSTNEQEFIAEGWIQRKEDFNYQIWIESDGKINFICLSKQFVKKIIYQGSEFTKDIPDEIFTKFVEYTQKIGKALFTMGFYGIVGIDAFIDEDNNIYPMIEMNVRLNFSTYLYNAVNIFKQCYGISCTYHDVTTQSPLCYKDIKTILEKKGLMVNKQKGVGLMPIIPSLLSYYYDNNMNLYFSRLYLLEVYQDKFSRYNNEIAAVLDEVKKY